MSIDQWVADDPSVPPDDILYRRVPRKPDFIMVDLLTGERRLQESAFRYKDDGMSVYRRARLSSRDQSCSDLPWDRRSYLIAAFPVSSVREAGGGVVDKEDPGDATTGHAHALVRTPSPPPDKAAWRQVRRSLMQQAVPIDLLAA